QKAQMPPAVALAPQVRRAVATVGRERRRNLRDLQSIERRLDGHLAGEFHAGRAQVELLNRVAPKPAQAAMKIVALALEEQSARAPASSAIRGESSQLPMSATIISAST